MAQVIFHRLAQREYLKAFDHYAVISPELAAGFKEEIDKAIGRISESPKLWPPFGKSFRWAMTKRFPYILYFQVHDDNVEILAVSHSRRRSAYWKGRRYY